MKKYLLLTAMLLGLSGCALYKQYESTSEAPVALMGEGVEAGESMAVVPWRTFFPDAQLQALIEEGLEHNSNLKISALNIEIAEVSLQTARLAWLPSLNLTPSFQYQGSASYNVGAGLQWDLDFFGGISSRRRQAQALLAQVKDEKSPAGFDGPGHRALGTIAGYSTDAHGERQGVQHFREPDGGFATGCSCPAGRSCQ